MNRKKVWTYSLSALAVAGVVCLLVYITVSHRRRVERYDFGYSQIKVGDSKQSVTSLMGEPARVGRCGYTPFNDKKAEEQFRAKCAEQYTYEILLQDYVISFDKDGTVVGKSSATSP
jgi:hypothetical protein